MPYEVAPAWLRLGEPAPEPLSEADLSLIWEGQRFPPEALTTVDGRAVAVVNPGRRGGAAGPDFVDAVVLLDGVERRGAVELHVRASAFRGHGHASDPAYGHLALHVVYRADDGAETALCGGGRAPVAAFAPWLERRGAQLEGWLAAPSMWQEPCQGVVGRSGEESVRQVLRETGRRRFRARSESAAASARDLGAEETLWRALLDTLGVGGDRDGFRRLAEAFPAALAARVQDLEGALMHAAGLGEAGAHAAELPRLRPGLRAVGRPANHPRRRLSGLARLYERACDAERSAQSADGVEGRAIWQSGNGARSSRAETRAVGPLVEMALASLRGADVGQALATWQVGATEGPALIGADRARELLVNAVLPLAAAQGLEATALHLLESLPASPSYGKTAFLESNLRPEKGGIARSALEQQGLLGLIGEWCSRGGCGRCPLS